jgi:hypothetical protein
MMHEKASRKEAPSYSVADIADRDVFADASVKVSTLFVDSCDNLNFGAVDERSRHILYAAFWKLSEHQDQEGGEGNRGQDASNLGSIVYRTSLSELDFGGTFPAHTYTRPVLDHVAGDP